MKSNCKKENFKCKKKRILLTIMLFCIALFGATLTGEAASKKPSCAKTKTAYYRLLFKGSSSGYDGYKINSGNTLDITGIKIKNLSKNAKVTNVKSSNPKIAVAKYEGSFYQGLRVYLPWKNGKYSLKEGTTTISCTVKQNGKSYKLSCRYTVKKTPSPLKSFKINGKQYTSKFKGNQTLNIKTGKTAKISFTRNKNVKSLKVFYYKDDKKIFVKNNSKIAVPKEGLTLTVSYRYKGKNSVYNKYYKTVGDDFCTIDLSR